MKSKSNPRFASLSADVRNQLDHMLVLWQGDCWRFQSVSHPCGADILSGMGALKHGGRWNAPQSFRAVYGSTTGPVALAESDAHATYYRTNQRNARIYVCISLKLSRVLDLTLAANLKRLKLAGKHLRAEDWRKIQANGLESLTQCIGRAAFVAGVEALLLKSASVKGGINIAYFPENRLPGSTVVLHDETALERMVGGAK